MGTGTALAVEKRRGLVARYVAAVACTLSLTLGLAARAAAQDVVWLNELETNPKLIGKEIVVEGLYSARVGQNRDQLKLKNSKVEFRVPLEQADRLPSAGRFVRLTGTLSESDGKLIMRVKTVAPTSATDKDRYDDAARNIGPRDYQGWYDLAERTQRLAAFHSNNDLRARAQEAMLKGFQVEESLVKPAQFEDLLALADRVEKAGFSGEDRRMRHKALRQRFDALAGAGTIPEDWGSLATLITKLLPGAQGPLRPVNLALASRYADAKNPNDIYDSHVSERDAFDREFWSVVTTRRLLAESEEPSADLVRLSDRAKQLLPDHPEVWQQLLSRWAEAEARKLANLANSKTPGIGEQRGMGRTEVLKLAQTFRNDLGKPERADALIRQWLDMKRSKLSKRDAESRYQLARDYRLELKDDTTAIRLLSEAIEIDPDPVRPQESDELKTLGFVKGPRGWVRGEPTAIPAPTDPNSPRDTLPSPNMTADQVRQLLRDPRPEEVLRVGIAGQVFEQWSYRGPPDIYVTFRLSRSVPSVVVSVHTQK